jgi:small-conductance mechanosensitive channel
MFCSKFKFKFRNNKNYSSITVNFHTGLRWKYFTLKLKFRKIRSYNKRTDHWYIVTYLSLKPLKQRLIDVTSSRLSKPLYSPPVLFKALIILVLFFQIISTAQFTRPNFRQKSDFFFQFSICRIVITFPSTLNAFHLYVTVATLSCYQSPVNGRRKNEERNFTHKVNYRYCCHFPGLEFM